MKNNLFKYATSELSQDAFISWLMSYAMQDAKPDIGLRKCALALVKEFIPKLATWADDSIVVTEIKTQYKKIDVLLTVNDKYKVIIEDKTNTSEHDNQLSRYKEAILKDGAMEEDVFCIYYKTGFDSDLSSVMEAGYQVFDRKRILEVLNAHSHGINNDIFLDYLDFYNNFESESLEYKNLPVCEWSWNMVLAFYDHLKHEHQLNRSLLNGELNFEYVPNPYGGFYGFWLFPSKKLNFGEDTMFRPYLQIETRSRDIVGLDAGDINICLKLCIDTPSTVAISSSLKNTIIYNNTSEWKYALERFGFQKPSRLGNGRAMTIGKYWKDAKCPKENSQEDINNPSCEKIMYTDIIKALEKSIEQFPKFYEHVEKIVAK